MKLTKLTIKKGSFHWSKSYRFKTLAPDEYLLLIKDNRFINGDIMAINYAIMDYRYNCNYSIHYTTKVIHDLLVRCRCIVINKVFPISLTKDELLETSIYIEYGNNEFTLYIEQ